MKRELAKVVETWGNGAIMVKFDEIPELDYMDEMACGNRTYFLFTMRGNCQKDRENALQSARFAVEKGYGLQKYQADALMKNVDELMAEAYARTPENKQVSICPNGAMICSGRHPDHGKMFWVFEKGSKFKTDGKIWEIVSLGDWPRVVEVAA